MTRIPMLIATALALLVCVSGANATMISVHADLDGLQVVAPNASPAFGALDATLNDANGDFTVVSGTYQDLLGGATAAILNDAAPGFNGPLIFLLTLDTPGAASGTFSGMGSLNATQMADMIAGNTYVRIASQVFPSGEIRGQLFVTPEPSSVILFCLGGLGVLAVARRQRKIAAS